MASLPVWTSCVFFKVESSHRPRKLDTMRSLDFANKRNQKIRQVSGIPDVSPKKKTKNTSRVPYTSFSVFQDYLVAQFEVCVPSGRGDVQKGMRYREPSVPLAILEWFSTCGFRAFNACNLAMGVCWRLPSWPFFGGRWFFRDANGRAVIHRSQIWRQPLYGKHGKCGKSALPL